MKLGYESPMLVDLDEVAADCSLGGVCVTGGGSLDIKTPIDTTVDATTTTDRITDALGTTVQTS